MRHWRLNFREHPAFGRWYTHYERSPGWALPAAITVAATVVLIPLLLLMLAAIAAGTIVFVTIVLIARIMTAVRNLWPNAKPTSTDHDDEGRENVRVIIRQ